MTLDVALALGSGPVGRYLRVSREKKIKIRELGLACLRFDDSIHLIQLKNCRKFQ